MWTDTQGMQPESSARALAKEEIAVVIAEYVNSAKLAIEAGFDGVEIHAANGYLIEQFLNPISNQRTDEYGATPENRNRFLLELAAAIVAEIGMDKTGIRISPYGAFGGLGAFEGIDEQYLKLVAELGEIGLVYLHLVNHESMGAPKVPPAFIDALRNDFSATFILSGGYDNDRANDDLVHEKGDLVAFGRPYLSNPDLVERLQHGWPLAAANPDLFYTPAAEGYTDYAAHTA
jgi:N-ethylmaleimide reductase